MKDGFLDNLPDIEIRGPEKNDRKRPVVTDGVVIKYVRIKCPRCGSYEVPVYDSSHLPVRYHKCKKCNLNFKTIE